jgi:signal recognition particle receptor subunit beta
MVDIHLRERTVRVKLVYYGPAVGGKTTNLKVLHEQALGARRGQFVSVNSTQDRTILCDLLPLRSGGFRGYDLKLQLVAVPGQAMYSATRRIVVKGADGVVFVANSASDRWHENLKSLQEMVANLMTHRLDPTRIPLVFQYNKRDLPDVVPVPALSRALNGRHAPEFAAVAAQGEGVLETFSTILAHSMMEVCRQYPALQLPAGQSVETWTSESIRAMFGRESFSAPAPAAEEVLDPGDIGLEEDPVTAPFEAAEPLKLQIPTAGDVSTAGAAVPEAASAESLAESYAQASAELGLVVDDLREERDIARLRLEEVRRALALATAPGRTEIEERVRRMLKVFVKAAGADGATLWLSSAAEAGQFLVLPPLSADPLSRTVQGSTRLAEMLKEIAEPLLEDAASSPAVTDALRRGQPSFEAVVAVPLLSAERLLGLALLYFGPHAALPPPDTLLHLGFLARVLAGPLEATAAREATDTADRLRVLSRPAAAAVASLLARLPPESARRQRLAVSEVIAPLEAPGVALEAPAGAWFLGDAPLLRFALATLVRQCEADALEHGRIPEVTIRVNESATGVEIQVAGGGKASVLTSPEAGPDLADAELSVVHAIVALHGGVLVAGRDDNQSPHFFVRLVAA